MQEPNRMQQYLWISMTHLESKCNKSLDPRWEVVPTSFCTAASCSSTAVPVAPPWKVNCCRTAWHMALHKWCQLGGKLEANQSRGIEWQGPDPRLSCLPRTGARAWNISSWSSTSPSWSSSCPKLGTSHGNHKISQAIGISSFQTKSSFHVASYALRACILLSGQQRNRCTQRFSVCICLAFLKF